MEDEDFREKWKSCVVIIIVIITRISLRLSRSLLLQYLRNIVCKLPQQGKPRLSYVSLVIVYLSLLSDKAFRQKLAIKCFHTVLIIA